MAFDQKAWYAKWSAEYRKRPEVRARRNERAKLASRRIRAAANREEWNAKQRVYTRAWSKQRALKSIEEFESNPFCVASHYFLSGCKRLKQLTESNRKICNRFAHYLNPAEKKFQLRTWRLASKYGILSDPIRKSERLNRARANQRRSYKKRGLSYIREYLKKPENKLRWNIRSRLRSALKTGGFSRKTTALVGCTYAEVVKHIESLWLPGMSWDNYGSKSGQWNLDHVKPLAAFHLSDQEQQKAACHYTNIQPLWAKDNFHKNSFWQGRKWTHTSEGKELAA
jgi:hypothetical protein